MAATARQFGVEELRPALAPDASADRKRAFFWVKLLGFQQDAGQFATLQQNIIGPFQREGFRAAGEINAGVKQGQRRHETAQRDRLRMFRQSHDQGGGKVPRRHGPRPPAPPLGSGLLVRKDPRWPLN